jgi:hypothetical protein
MNLLEYEQYFEAIALKKIIGHTIEEPRFLLLDDSELESVNSRLTNDSFFMVLHKFEAEIYTNESGAIFQRALCSFTIGQNIGKGLSEKMPKKLQNDAFIICKKIIAKMLKDQREGDFTIGYLEKKDITITFMKGMLSNAAGATTDFTIVTPLALFCQFDKTEFE